MKLLLCLFCLTVFIRVGAQPPYHIIPQPLSLMERRGEFELKPDSKIYIGPGSAELTRVGTGLVNRLFEATGILHPTTPDQTEAAIVIRLQKDAELGNEGYRLSVSTQRIFITAPTAAGIFYGIQSLYQLLPPAIESKQRTAARKWKIRAVEIMDKPRFAWRGLMFDVSRHFFTKEDVKKYIDQMVKYKYNLLHLHLTDDQGWRIQIKSLPKLTEVGAWRADRTGTFGTFAPLEPGEPQQYGGFYTHEDIRELVQYAKERFVDILPEIDVPGHSLAAIASYPHLSCTPGEYRVSHGDRFMIWPPSGHFYGLIDNTLCPANEKVYEFLDKVFTEVAQLFPFEYIHMGGDETARNFWEKTDAIKELMKRENLASLDEVQSYFVKRVEKIIASKGKKTIGWDEILDGGLAPGAAVMSWRGFEGGVKAAAQKHEVVMSPTTHAYLDYMQADEVLEAPVYASLRLNKSYEFDPLPPGTDAQYIKGGQANLWTEQIYNLRQAQYMTWPRGMAIAESVWSQPEKKDWKDFVRRVENHFTRLDLAEVKYCPAIYDPSILPQKNAAGQLLVEMKTEIDGLDIHYSFDNSTPDKFYPKYNAPLPVPKDASRLKLITYRDGKPVGRLMTITVDELKRRVK